MSEKLNQVKETVISCTNCSLSRTRTKAVPGKGNSKTDVIFVGEAPGRSEDLRGEPFVGNAGQILTEALSYAGFDRGDVYITNVVKCRPPNNRRPAKQEVESCMPYLTRELEIIQPKITCILGNTAFGSLLNGNAITKNRGKVIKRDGKLYFVTVHPAAAIYTPDLRQILKDDLKTLAGIIEKIKKGIPVDIVE